MSEPQKQQTDDGARKNEELTGIVDGQVRQFVSDQPVDLERVSSEQEPIFTPQKKSSSCCSIL